MPDFREPQAKVALAELDPGLILITSRPQTAAVSADPPDDKMESAGEGAGAAVRSVLNTPSLGHAQLEAAVGVLEFAAVPFAAAYGAVSATRQRVPPAKLSEAERILVANMRLNADSKALREKVAEVARQKTCRLLAVAPSVSAAPASRVPLSAVLEVAVEQFRLQVANPGEREYILLIEARARLCRAADAAVLIDKSYQYKSGPALFIDWANPVGLTSVVETAYQSLAEQIANEVFQPASEPPLLLGPGLRRSSLSPGGAQRPCASRRRDEWRPAPGPGNARPAFMHSPDFQFVGFGGGNVTSIEVYTIRTDQRLPGQMPASGVEGGTEMPSDTEWKLDGLENDRNAVVQWTACLAAVPLGLWEQTVGLIYQRRRDKNDRLQRTLDAIPDQRHFADGLADEVARRLGAHVVNEIRRMDAPPAFALGLQGEARAAGLSGLGDSTESPLALQLQLVNAKLAGKHRNSRSRALCVELQATIIRTSDGQELYSRPIRYRSAAKKLKDWDASDAKLFRQELDACTRETAQALTQELIERGFVTKRADSLF